MKERNEKSEQYVPFFRDKNQAFKLHVKITQSKFLFSIYLHLKRDQYSTSLYRKKVFKYIVIRFNMSIRQRNLIKYNNK